MRRHELPNNTDEQVGEYVAKALDLVAALGVDEPLREAVFTIACNLYSSKQILMEQPQPIALDPRLIGRG